MTHKDFNKLVEELETIRINTLKIKNAKYAPEDDALHNFHAGAEIMGTTTAQCIWGYATKHIVALRDKILTNNFSDMDDVLEKIQDIQNYLSFIYCAANEKAVTEENICPNNSNNKQIVCDNCNCGSSVECTLEEAPCSCCQHFEAMLARPDNNPYPICARCKNYYAINSEEWNKAKYNFVRNCGHNCETCRHCEKEPIEFPCSKCKYNQIIGTMEYEEAPDFWEINN